MREADAGADVVGEHRPGEHQDPQVFREAFLEGEHEVRACDMLRHLSRLREFDVVEKAQSPAVVMPCFTIAKESGGELPGPTGTRRSHRDVLTSVWT